MRIIEIEAQGNGAHRNQTSSGSLPDGWAVVPDALSTPNYPFGSVTVADVDGVPCVTAWSPLPLPEPTPTPEPAPSIDERMAAVEDAIGILLSGRVE